MCPCEQYVIFPHHLQVKSKWMCRRKLKQSNTKTIHMNVKFMTCSWLKVCHGSMLRWLFWTLKVEFSISQNVLANFYKWEMPDLQITPLPDCNFRIKSMTFTQVNLTFGILLYCRQVEDKIPCSDLKLERA